MVGHIDDDDVLSKIQVARPRGGRVRIGTGGLGRVRAGALFHFCISFFLSFLFFFLSLLSNRLGAFVIHSTNQTMDAWMSTKNTLPPQKRRKRNQIRHIPTRANGSWLFGGLGWGVNSVKIIIPFTEVGQWVLVLMGSVARGVSKLLWS